MNARSASTAPGPRPFNPVAWQPRLLVLLKRSNPSDTALGALRDLGPALAGAYPGTRVRVSVASGDSPLTRSLVEFRGYELMDAVAEISWPIDAPLEEVDWRLAALQRTIGDAAKIRTLIAGAAVALLDDPAPNFLLMTGIRVPGVSVADFRHWWLRQHAPLVERYCYPMQAYEQLHAERVLSETLCRTAQVDFRPADAADSVYLADVDAFFAQVGRPDVEKLLRDDEIPFSDVTAGGMGMVGTVVFDSLTSRS
jgi:hypothetical protein